MSKSVSEFDIDSRIVSRLSDLYFEALFVTGGRFLLSISVVGVGSCRIEVIAGGLRSSSVVVSAGGSGSCLIEVTAGGFLSSSVVVIAGGLRSGSSNVF